MENVFNQDENIVFESEILFSSVKSEKITISKRIKMSRPKITVCVCFEKVATW